MMMPNAPPSPTSPMSHTSPMSLVPPSQKRTRFMSALSALAHLASAAREPPAPAPAPSDAELRRLWRPVAVWRVTARRAGADDAAAADAALAMWAGLAAKAIPTKVQRSLAARGLALGLARALATLPIAPRDDATQLAAAAVEAITQVRDARADAVDAAVGVARAAATVEELERAARLCRDAFARPQDAATTDFWRPPPTEPPLRSSLALLRAPLTLPSEGNLAAAHAAHCRGAALPQLCACRRLGPGRRRGRGRGAQAVLLPGFVGREAALGRVGALVVFDDCAWTYDPDAARMIVRDPYR